MAIKEPQLKENREPVTRELAHRTDLIFFPQTQEESATLQQQLFRLGFAWSGGGKAVANEPRVISRGLVILDGEIYWRGDDDTRPYAVATIAQTMPGYSSPLQQEFARINARLDALEKKINEIHDAVVPKEVDKPVLRKPSTGATP